MIYLKFLLTFTLFFSLINNEFSFAEPLKFDVTPNDQLVISGYLGTLQLHQSGSSQQLQIRFKERDSSNSPSYLVEKQGNNIVVKINGPSTKDELKKTLRSGRWGFFDVEIYGKSLPTKIFLKEGHITINNWSSDISLLQVKGDLRLLGCDGSFQGQIDEGKAFISNHKGPLRISSFKSQMEIDKIDGKMNIENFGGLTKINNALGDISLKTTQGASFVQGGHGKFLFENGRGNISIRNFSGEIEGNTEEGSVNMILQDLVNVRIKSNQGHVSIKAPHQSGATLNLGTTDGDFVVPKHLKITHHPDIKYVTGNLLGSNPGSIYVRTKQGQIRIQ